jgi:DNA-binding NarL/FixJ family response regulator
MAERILCVDDEPSVLEGFQRALRKRFAIETAIGGEAGLAALEKAPCAVVVSDMRMPGMDGTRLLAAVKERWPETVRVMLTGESDIKATITAVNAGNLFRFLTKPCSPDELATTIEAALVQHRLLVAERDLLEKTLSGSVKMLTEMMSLASPRAFGRSLRAKRYARHIAERLGMKTRWQVELATMLSQIGCITLPAEVLDRLVANQPLTGQDLELAEGRHLVARNLIAHIPRLEAIARIIELQLVMEKAEWPDDPCLVGAQVVFVALEIDALIAQGVAPSAGIGQLRLRLGARFTKILDALGSYDFGTAGQAVRAILSKDLALGMVLDEDVRTKNGLLLVSKGQEATQAVIERLRNYAKQVGIAEPFRVLVPAA